MSRCSHPHGGATVSLILSAVLVTLSLAMMSALAFATGAMYNRRLSAGTLQQLQICRDQAAEQRRLMRGRVETLLQREQLCEEREAQLAEAVRMHDVRLRQIEKLAESLGLATSTLDTTGRANSEWVN